MSANTARKSSASGVAGWNRKVPSTVRADRRGRAGVFPITCVEVAPEYRSKAQVSACATTTSEWDRARSAGDTTRSAGDTTSSAGEKTRRRAHGQFFNELATENTRHAATRQGIGTVTANPARYTGCGNPSGATLLAAPRNSLDARSTDPSAIIVVGC